MNTTLKRPAYWLDSKYMRYHEGSVAGKYGINAAVYLSDLYHYIIANQIHKDCYVWIDTNTLYNTLHGFKSIRALCYLEKKLIKNKLIDVKKIDGNKSVTIIDDEIIEVLKCNTKAFCDVKKDANGDWIIIVPVCPYCGGVHYHNGGKEATPILGVRISHCALNFDDENYVGCSEYVLKERKSV